MTDPRRWLDPESDARTFEREALELAKPVRIPLGSQDRVWQRVALLTQVTPGADPSATGAGAGSGGVAPAAASASGLGAIKVFVAGAVGGFALAGGGYVALVEDAPHAPSPPVVLASAPRVEQRAPVAPPSAPEERALEPAERSPLEVAPLPRRVAAPSLSSALPAPVSRRTEAFDAPSVTSTPSPNESQLKEEVALIREARARLRAGDLGGAFATLETARTRFPHAVLEEEREALTIELLSRSGRAESARERARAFLVRFPESSLRQRMLELSGEK